MSTVVAGGVDDVDGVDDVELIGRSAFDFAQGFGGVTRARAVRDQWPSADAAAWRRIAEMGWFAMLVPETQDGLGLGARALAVLAEQIGRVLMPEPVVQAIAMAWLLARGGADAHLLSLVSGEDRYAMLSVERGESGAPLWVSADAGDVARLVALGADAIGVRLIDPHAEGVTRVDRGCVDGSTLSVFTISRQAWRMAEPLAVDADAFDEASDLMRLGHAALLVGLMDSALSLSVDYLKTRMQFGVPIGSFQALQHRAASCHVDVASSRALLGEAVRAFDAGSAIDAQRCRRRAAAALKIHVADAAMRVVNACVQFHGAIGFADEHDIGLFYRRAMVLAARDGNTQHPYERFSAA